MKIARTVGHIAVLLAIFLLPACASSEPAPPTIAAETEAEIGVSRSVALAYDPSDGSLLRADQEGLFRWRSTVGWTEVDALGSAGFSAVVVDPDQPATVYASGVGLGVIRSDDAGETWRGVSVNLVDLDVTALAIHSFRRKTLFAWVEGDGSYRTEDGGKSWLRMPDPAPPDADVRGLTHSTLPGSMNTGWLYAATPTGAYLSMDCF